MRSIHDPQRLWDLARFMRVRLHEKNLINDDEYIELSRDEESVKRLEADDIERAANNLKTRLGIKEDKHGKHSKRSSGKVVR